MEPQRETAPIQETKAEPSASPEAAPAPRARSVMSSLRRSWQITRHRRSFVLATGITVLAVLLSCILGARPVANSVGLDQSSYQPRAGNDQQALRQLIDHICATHDAVPENPCVVGVRSTLFKAFQVSQSAIDQEVREGNTPFAAIHFVNLGCPDWQQAMTRLVASLGDLVHRKTISATQSDEVVAWFQDREDAACAFVVSSGNSWLTPTPAPLPSGSNSSCPPIPGFEDATVEAQLLATVNQARADAGVAALSNEDLIQREALVHSEDMTCYGMSHYVPPGTDPASRMAAVGVTFTWHGENIGWSGVGSDWDKVMWLFNSMMAEQPPNDGHRQNILSPHFDRTGIGIYVENASGRLWLTEDFAG